MRFFTKQWLIVILIAIATCNATAKTAKEITVASPDGKAIIRLDYSAGLKVSVDYLNKQVMSASPVSMSISEHPEAFQNPVRGKVITRKVNSEIIPVVAEKRNRIIDQYNETEIWFKGNYGIKLRAYNDGVAWRLLTRFADSITVTNEQVVLNMAAADSVYYGDEDNFVSHSERFYTCRQAGSIKGNQMGILPAVFRKANGSIAAFTESDLLDYPGLYLLGSDKGDGSFSGTYPKVVERMNPKGDRDYGIESRKNYIARTRGTREFPWRAFGLAENEARLLENDITYRLGSPCKLKETSWIKPGKVAWDWWNDWNIAGVPFKAGINTETYKYYIDFASKNKLEYVIFDEGWSKPEDLEKINPDMDMDALFAYAKSKNVGIILWVTGRALEEKFESSFEKFSKWGCVGVKVDFLCRDDQAMVNFYERVAVTAAKYHMLADFHGSYKPTGLSRTYPNALTREGVKGLENVKWSKQITPAHDCTLPFTRMFAGTMDYTPGAMHNENEKTFTINYSAPMSMGTRCHEMAKYVVFESPLQMLCDNPTNYLKEPECLSFIAGMPVTWDDTRCINASVSRYVTVARKHNNEWFIGSMTDFSPRNFEIPLSFLEDGNYQVTVFEDGINAERRAEDYAVKTFTVTSKSVLPVKLAPGGGFVCRITKL
ncbi:MAG: glycoside hydrolase family 97 catalytic domain-containing protein [Bacteroidales bacterium]